MITNVEVLYKETPGTWFVLCERARTIPLTDLAQRVTHLRDVTDVTIGSIDDSLQVTVRDSVTGRSAWIAVGLSTEPHVVLESAEIAEFHANDRSDRAAIAAADARYEIVWDLKYSYEVYNTLAGIAEKLEKATAGVIFHPAEARFI
jgi:hypothetical protein